MAHCQMLTEDVRRGRWGAEVRSLVPGGSQEKGFLVAHIWAAMCAVCPSASLRYSCWQCQLVIKVFEDGDNIRLGSSL